VAYTGRETTVGEGECMARYTQVSLVVRNDDDVDVDVTLYQVSPPTRATLHDPGDPWDWRLMHVEGPDAAPGDEAVVEALDAWWDSMEVPW
jgi:hypothetical protein